MKSKAFDAIRAAADTAGATSVSQDGNITVVAYKGAEIRIGLDMSPRGGWSVTINGQADGYKSAPSSAFKFAAKEVDRRLTWAADSLKGLHNVAADKGAEIVSIEDDKVVMTYEDREVVATKPTLLWTATCEGEQLAHGSLRAWEVLRHAICTLEERIQAAADGALSLVLTLGPDRVEVVVECDDTDEDPKAFDRAMAAAITELSDIAGETVILKPVGDDDEGDGVLRAYRMPRGDYYADDIEVVERFGVPCGRFRILGDEDIPTLTLPAWSRFGAYRAIDLGVIRDPNSVGIFQPLAKLRASLEKMPVVRHDDGPVELYGVEAYVTLRLENGTARIHGGHENVMGHGFIELGYRHCIKLPSDMPGRRLAAALSVAEALMPTVAAGFVEDENGRVDLTPAARAALRSVCEPLEDLILSMDKERRAA